jgi:hypothetical protein
MSGLRDTFRSRDGAERRGAVEGESREIRVSLTPAEERNEAMPLEILRVSPLWLEWFAIAHEHASEAREHAGPPELGSTEWRAAMVAVTAAAFALEGFHGAVKRVLGLPKSKSKPRRSRKPRQSRKILEVLKLGFRIPGQKSEKEWLPAFDWLFVTLRDPAVHHGEKPQPQVSHPELDDARNIAVESRNFSAAHAERSVALVLDVLNTCFASPKPATREWVERRRPAVSKLLADLGVN